jgi:hypothetical protein
MSSSGDNLSVPEVDEESIRRAIRNLGRTNEREREASRALILSVGDYVLPILLSELEVAKRAHHQRSKRVIVFCFILYVLVRLAEMVSGRSWSLRISGSVVTLVLMIRVMTLFTYPRWMRQATNLLTEFEGAHVTCAMIDAYSSVTGAEQGSLRAAIIRRLAAVTPEDASWLSGDTRKRVIEILKLSSWSQPSYAEDVLTLGRALCTVGAVEALPTLRQVQANAAAVGSRSSLRLKENVGEFIRELEEIAEKRKPGERLLRPATLEEDVLLRPDVTNDPSDPTILLRPSDENQRLQVNHGRNA